MRPAWIIFAAALAVAACQPQKPAAPVKTETPVALPVTPPPVAALASTAAADCPCAEDAKPKIQKASTRPRKTRRAQRAPAPAVGGREYARPPADYTGPGYVERTPQRVPERIDEAPDFAPAFASRDRYGFLNWPGKTPARP